jgi:hypothetical protein
MTQAELQAILDAAVPTDVIQIPDGIIDFPFTISKDCTVMGSPNTVVDVSAIDSHYAVNITALNASLTDMRIVNKTAQDYVAVKTKTFSGNLERLTTIANIGVLLDGAIGANLSAIEGSGCSIGLKMVDSQHISVDDCNFCDNSIGADVAGSSNKIGSIPATQLIKFTYANPGDATTLVVATEYHFIVDGNDFYVVFPLTIPTYQDVVNKINALIGTRFSCALTAEGILFTSKDFTIDIGTGNLITALSATIMPPINGTEDVRIDRSHDITFTSCDFYENAIGVRTINVNAITFTDCRLFTNSNIGWWNNPNSYNLVYRGEVYNNANFGIKNTDKLGTIHIIDASETWWGDVTGPSQFGPGSGDKISQGVLAVLPRVSGTEPNLTYPKTRNFIWGMLGYPAIKVELTEDQVTLCIEKAIQRYMQYRTPEPTNRYISIAPGQTTAELPLDLPKEEIIEITYSPNTDMWSQLSSTGDMFMAYFIQQNRGQYLTDVWMALSYKKTFEKVMGLTPTYELLSYTNKNGELRDIVRLSPHPANGLRLCILFNRPLSEEEADQISWIHKYALSWAKELLGRIRGKFSSVPGPTGEMSLDGGVLLSEAATEREKLEAEIVLIGEPLGFSIG